MSMLWYKAWLETRWRFAIGLALVLCSAAGVVFIWPRLMEMLPVASSLQMEGEIGRKIREGMQLSREYRGYIWSQWFRQNAAHMVTLFAVILGTGSLLSQRVGGLFTLSLPISRRRILGTRAAIGLAELLVLAVAPSLFICLVSPAIGKSYGVSDALAQSVCLFVAAAVFFSMSFLLSTVFADLWRPLLFALLAAIVLGLCEDLFLEFARYGIFRVMSGEDYFRHGSLPWVGMFLSLAASCAMLYGAGARTDRQDF